MCLVLKVAAKPTDEDAIVASVTFCRIALSTVRHSEQRRRRSRTRRASVVNTTDGILDLCKLPGLRVAYPPSRMPARLVV